MTPKRKPSAKPKTVAAYLALLSPEKRAALQGLRAVIRAAVPSAEECISYGIPAFRLNGRFLVGYGAGASHCSFYPGASVQEFAAALTGFDTSKGTIRFQPDMPIPKTLVRSIVKAQVGRKSLGTSQSRLR